jgi:hypothetical protein
VLVGFVLVSGCCEFRVEVEKRVDLDVPVDDAVIALPGSTVDELPGEEVVKLVEREVAELVERKVEKLLDGEAIELPGTAVVPVWPGCPSVGWVGSWDGVPRG